MLSQQAFRHRLDQDVVQPMEQSQDQFYPGKPIKIAIWLKRDGMFKILKRIVQLSRLSEKQPQAVIDARRRLVALKPARQGCRGLNIVIRFSGQYLGCLLQAGQGCDWIPNLHLQIGLIDIKAIKVRGRLDGNLKCCNGFVDLVLCLEAGSGFEG